MTKLAALFTEAVFVVSKHGSGRNGLRCYDPVLRLKDRSYSAPASLRNCQYMCNMSVKPATLPSNSGL